MVSYRGAIKAQKALMYKDIGASLLVSAEELLKNFFWNSYSYAMTQPIKRFEKRRSGLI
jgi:hypothetical protein